MYAEGIEITDDDAFFAIQKPKPQNIVVKKFIGWSKNTVEPTAFLPFLKLIPSLHGAIFDHFAFIILVAGVRVVDQAVF